MVRGELTRGLVQPWAAGAWDRIGYLRDGVHSRPTRKILPSASDAVRVVLTALARLESVLGHGSLPLRFVFFPAPSSDSGAPGRARAVSPRLGMAYGDSGMVWRGGGLIVRFGPFWCVLPSFAAALCGEVVGAG